MKYLIIIMAVFSSAAYAKAYKCEVDGKTIYQQSPCSNNGNVKVFTSKHDRYEAKRQKALIKQRQRYELEQKNREKLIASSYFSKKEKELIRSKKVNVGMSKDAVILSWGKPTKINDSSYGSQWIYRYSTITQYVHFRNGIVSSWSNN